ncbi:hypothetical protein EON65_48275 [archaeon]|nr:MAG: hypothetical protein EON65_48275 [archaeon]
MGDSDSDDDLGPKPIVPETDGDHGNEEPARKKAKVKRSPGKFESFHLEQLPSADYYEYSYMHRDIVTHICVSKATEFIITGSADGHVKFWKKMETDIEFVKHYHAHLGPLHDMVISSDGKLLATTSSDQMVKIFEVASFDMASMLEMSCLPLLALFLPSLRGVVDRIAVSDQQSGDVHIFSLDRGEKIHTLTLHRKPVAAWALHPTYSTVIRYGVWCMEYSIGCMAFFGVWYMVGGVCGAVFYGWCVRYIVWCVVCDA